MNQEYYSNLEFSELRKRINHEIQRRSTYSYWDPLTTPSVGTDMAARMSIPDGEIQVTDKTYTINNPSDGSIEPTRNIQYPDHGSNPAGVDTTNEFTVEIPNTSAAELNVDELRNYLVGLAKIQDINLFYGRDEIANTAFRNPQGIEDAVLAAENSKLNAWLHESDVSATKNDPNGGITDIQNPNYPAIHSITYPKENGIYVMPSGEYNGEELKSYQELGVTNFYDDYGAEPGDSNYHPINRNVSEQVHRDWYDQDNDRNEIHTPIIEGGLPSSRFGQNPRNPQLGEQYRSRPVYGGKKGSCNSQCTGLCYITCDNQCSESCTTTCFSRCGNACTASCTNGCTGCSTQCYQSCKTKCENTTGYSCVKSGAETVSITSVGGYDGIPAQNRITYTTHTCQGCSYSCQFYPNKKTECWDSGCMGKCFITCSSSCSTSCYGGCINNNSEKSNGYKSGKGQGCSGGCTLNCIGLCSGVCEGDCISTCFNACKSSCSDNCTYTCSTNCGDGCMNGCTNGCTGCAYTCMNGCQDKAQNKSCSGCSAQDGCATSCMQDCNRNCMGWGCRSICGTEAAGACEANCRLSCMATSCTALCSNACSEQCTTCVNNCDVGCGACVSMCSTGCESACNINCTEECSNSCSDNCVHSCSEQCGACSSLCFSCVGLCIGVCMVKCENGCSSCANQCGWWCDSSCNRECLSNCSTFCINSCTGSCATRLMSDTTSTSGPDRPPTSDGYIYPHPSNRWEERESFKLTTDIAPYSKPIQPVTSKITVAIVQNRDLVIVETQLQQASDVIQRVISISGDSIKTNLGTVITNHSTRFWKYYKDEHFNIHIQNIYPGDFIYLWDIASFGEFDSSKMPYPDNRNLIVAGYTGLRYDIIQTTSTGGIYEMDSDGNIIINEDMLPGNVEGKPADIDKDEDIFIIRFYKDSNNISMDDIEFTLPIGFDLVGSMYDKSSNLLVTIKKDETIYP